MKIEVERSKVVNTLYCILFDKEYFHIEDVEARKILTLSETQLRWFLKEISEFLRGPENGFLLRNGFDDFGSTRLLKFRSKVGWVMRCVAWNRNKKLSIQSLKI